MNSKIRILHVIGTMDMGGAETMIMNLYRNIDRSRVQFDFFISTDNECYYNSEIKQLGGNIYNSVAKSRNPFKFSKDLLNVLYEQKYEAVHIHTSNAMAAIPAFVAKIMKVKKIIVHSHTSNDTGNEKLHKIMRVLLNRLATHKYSCSDKASEWMYGEKKNRINNN